MGRSDPKGKPFAIPKQLVWEAYRRVAANKGAPGLDGQSVAAFEADLRDNLYKIWNRMSSGTYFPPPVRAVEIPKPGPPRVFRTAELSLFHAASCRFRYSSRASCGVRYPSPE